MSGIEKHNTPETLEEKQKRVEGFDNFSSDAQSGFRDVADRLSLKKDGDRYTSEDIKNAASGRIDDILSRSGIQLTKLNEQEKKKLQDLKSEMLRSMDGKDMQGSLEAYNEVRLKIQGIIASGDGKQKQGDIGREAEQKRLQEAKQGTQDAFEKFQEFLSQVREDQRSREQKARDQQQIALKAGNRATGVEYLPYGKEVEKIASDNLALA